jgi:hypothetical protein
MYGQLLENGSVLLRITTEHPRFRELLGGAELLRYVGFKSSEARDPSGKWTLGGTASKLAKDKDGYIESQFAVGGHEYTFKVSPMGEGLQGGNVPSVQFSVYASPSRGHTFQPFPLDSHQETMQVFRAVADHLHAYIGQERPQEFTFSADLYQPSRVRLYDKFAAKIAGASDYDLVRWEGGGRINYNFIKTDKPKEKKPFRFDLSDVPADVLLRYESKWQPYAGKRGGKGWQNTADPTDIRYQTSRPRENEGATQQSLFDLAEEPAPGSVVTEGQAGAPQAGDVVEASSGSVGDAAAERLMGSLKTAKGLSPEQRETYGKAMQRVFAAIPQAGHDRLTANVKGVRFFGDGVKAALGYVKAADVDDFPQGYAIGGAYVPERKLVILDGDFAKDSDPGIYANPTVTPTHHIHAHEFTHGIDGPDRDYSSTPEWANVIKAEIATKIDGKPALSEYATRTRAEGFAEFGRLLYSGDYDLGEVAQKFPRASAFFKAQGLWPKANGPEPVAEFPEVFDSAKRLDFGPAGHTDTLLEPEPESYEDQIKRQIKSVGNRGTFDPNDERLDYELEGLEVVLGPEHPRHAEIVRALKYAFNKDEPRDEKGEWTTGGASSSPDGAAVKSVTKGKLHSAGHHYYTVWYQDGKVTLLWAKNAADAREKGTKERVLNDAWEAQKAGNASEAQKKILANRTAELAATVEDPQENDSGDASPGPADDTSPPAASDTPKNRAELKERGYMDMHANSDLLPYGYQIRHWINPHTKQAAIEYIWRPDRAKEKKAKNVGTSIVVQTYAEQAAFHKSIGAPIVPKGETFNDDDGESEQGWLYQREGQPGRYKFDPNEPRDKAGKWTGPGGESGGDAVQGELWTDVEEALPAGKPPSRATQRVTFFASGSNHSGEIKALSLVPGANVGVVAGLVGEAHHHARVALTRFDSGGKIFIDSGAFGEVAFGPAGPRVVKPMTDRDWQEIFKVYAEQARAHGRDCYVVAPDKVGFQKESLERLEKYAEHVREIMLLGATVLVPLQKGELSMAECYRRAEDILNAGDPEKDMTFRPSIAMKKDATNLKDLAAFCKEIKPASIHLLGIAPDTDRGRAAIQCVHENAPGCDVSCDACLIRRWVGKGNGPNGGPRRMTALNDAHTAKLALDPEPLGEHEVHVRKLLNLFLAASTYWTDLGLADTPDAETEDSPEWAEDLEEAYVPLFAAIAAQKRARATREGHKQLYQAVLQPLRYAFDPNEPRDEGGKWTHGARANALHEEHATLKAKRLAMYKDVRADARSAKFKATKHIDAIFAADNALTDAGLEDESFEDAGFGELESGGPRDQLDALDQIEKAARAALAREEHPVVLTPAQHQAKREVEKMDAECKQVERQADELRVKLMKMQQKYPTTCPKEVHEEFQKLTRAEAETTSSLRGLYARRNEMADTIPEGLTEDDVATKHHHLRAIIDNAAAARGPQREYIQHRKEMAAIRHGKPMKAKKASPVDRGDASPTDPDDAGGQRALFQRRPRRYARDLELRRAIKAAAADTDTSPTELQRKIGNYRKGHVFVQGLDISIETPAGCKRRPEWEPLAHHYGYIRQAISEADGDHIDVFIGPHPESETVFVVDQLKGWDFDEHKVMLGFKNAADAEAGYLANYEPGWQGLGALTEMTMPEFKDWIAKGDTGQEVGRYAAQVARQLLRYAF